MYRNSPFFDTITIYTPILPNIFHFIPHRGIIHFATLYLFSYSTDGNLPQNLTIRSMRLNEWRGQKALKLHWSERETKKRTAHVSVRIVRRLRAYPQDSAQMRGVSQIAAPLKKKSIDQLTMIVFFSPGTTIEILRSPKLIPVVGS